MEDCRQKPATDTVFQQAQKTTGSPDCPEEPVFCSTNAAQKVCILLRRVDHDQSTELSIHGDRRQDFTAGQLESAL